ncbi:hypothetical protein PtA15_5A782 [Puccinia triticina]|uniref:MIF4G domain-containing protein n=1 Tax=Puccinia triticina TaxID=208348 RepID=A0ABY7CJ14_9BASI|nr:uncharacterized protein PtA15_5A782 [Puccinia triticina]WAQ85208.1 hypothetical protein PtA15_5A782 [Puccinia triticina]
MVHAQDGIRVNALCLNGECALKLQPQLAKPAEQAGGSTNQELAAILKNQVIRIKKVLSSLQLRTLGRICEVLLALGDAIKIQPNVLLHELKFFGLATNTAGLF